MERPDEKELTLLRWGLVPHWAKQADGNYRMINARAETVAEKPSFRTALRRRRCLVPADGFYEWTKGPDGTRLPWYIHPADGGPMVLAGIWRDWEHDGQAMATVAAVPSVRSSSTS